VHVQYSYTSTPLCAVLPVQSLSVCTVQVYFHSPYGPYGLYRSSVLVEYSYTSTPPMDRRSLQGLSALHYSYINTPPMGRKVFTETECLYSTAITLLPLWTVLPVKSLSAFTVQLKLFTPVGRTHCTEPQCL